MNHNDAKSCLLHLHDLYPKAGKNWPAARQQAFRDHILPMPITVEQFRAASSDVAMTTKATWCPPEAEILKRCRGITESVGVARRVESTRKTSERRPGDRTAQEWTGWYLEDAECQQELEPAQLKGLSFLAGSRERRMGTEAGKNSRGERR